MDQQRIRRRLLLVGGGTAIAILAMIAVVVIQTSTKSNPVTPTEKETTVTILTSELLTDQSWGSLAYSGMMNIQDEFDVTTKIDSELATEEAKVNAAAEAAKAGSHVVIGHGREFAPIFATVAPDYPSTFFVSIHGDSTAPNQAVYTFDQGEIEYTAGVAATMVTKTKKIALIDAFEARAKNPLFEKAIRDTMPEAEFAYVVVGSREDGARALELMNDLLQDGYDVFYAKGNGFNREIIKRAKETNTYAIGYLDDQSYMGRAHVITSVMNSVPSAYTAIMRDYFSSSGLQSGKKILTEEDGVYGLADFGPMLSKEEINLLMEQRL